MSEASRNEAPGLRPRATIRPATRDDLPAVRELLSLRDGREWDQPSTNWFLCDLQPERCLAWLAWAEERPVGLTSMYIRQLHVMGHERRAGYWANLFVHPDYRDQMLYPRLPLTMNQALKRFGLDLVYSGIRQRDVAESHRKIGFAHAGRMNVLFKPLRPGRLLVKYKALGSSAQKLAAPLDWAYRVWLARTSLRARNGVDRLSPDGGEIDRLVEILDGEGERQITQRWSAEGFRDRFRRTREGGQYVFLGSRMGSEIVGAVVHRIAERSGGILAGVVMHALATPGQEDAVAPALIETERRCHRAGADLMLYLDGTGPAMGAVLRRLGYRVSRETYDLIIWPKSILAEEPSLTDLRNWRFAFADHDAF